MSDLLTVADLEAAKKHDTFHSEVITGKEGGVAGGASIDYATNEVTGQVQKTLPKTINDISDIVSDAVDAAIDEIDLTKPYITSISPSMQELGKTAYETFSARKSISTEYHYAETVKDSTSKLSRTFYGNTSFEPYHPSEFPVDFTPVAPELYIGSAYTTDPAFTERVYQGCSSAAKTGSRMWCGFRGDIQLYDEDGSTVSEHTGNFVTLCKSDDNGATWSEYGYIRYKTDLTKCCHEPTLWVAPDGKLWVFSTVSGNNTDTDGVFGVWAFVCKNPESDGEFLQWETPVKILPYGFVNYPPAEVNGKHLLGVYLLRNAVGNIPVYKSKVGKHVFEIDYINKKSFELSQLPASIDTSSFDEICITQNHDGSVRAIWRTANAASSMETCLSSDGGKTWGSASKYQSAIGDNSSTRAVIKTAPSGRTVLVYNNVATARQYLTVALSDDGGSTYPYKMLVEQPQPLSSSYPDVLFGNNGEFYIFYDKGRSTAGHRKIICTKMNEQDIIDNVFSPVNSYVSDKGYLA